MSDNISAALVKELRGKTSAPLLDCKKALEETNGDIEKAVEILKIKGLSKVDKKSGRDTLEGLVFSYIHAGGKIGVMLEINCETDFVARNQEFQDFAKEICMQACRFSRRRLMWTKSCRHQLATESRMQACNSAGSA